MKNVRITDQIDYGNLTGLIGTWVGDKGFNLIAVPDQKGGFSLLVAPYTETLEVTAVSATTPNRGLNAIANLPTLQYNTRIIDKEDNSLMHVENGFWELLTDKEANDGFDIFRVASIPHGDSLLAMGTSSSILGGAPVIDTSLSAQPIGKFPDGDGYDAPYQPPFKYQEFMPDAPNRYLLNYLTNQIQQGAKIKQSVTLNVSTKNKGGIHNIASVNTNTNTTQLDATFWLITFEDNTRQLMYSQNILIEFPVKFGDGGMFPIVWPHINVNILTWQPPN